MKSLIFQHFEETIPAGSYRTVHAYSRMLTILNNTAATRIHVGLGEMQPVPLKAGLQYELPQGDTFNQIIFYNQEVTETTVEFVVSMGGIRDNRLTITGSVFNDLLVAMQAIQAELQGILTAGSAAQQTIGTSALSVLSANANRKGFSIQAKEVNTGLIYVGFANTVTSSAYWVAELSAGMSFGLDDYRGPLFAIATAAGQLIGVGEW
jgi:hypothetical protein